MLTRVGHVFAFTETEREARLTPHAGASPRTPEPEPGPGQSAATGRAREQPGAANREPRGLLCQHPAPESQQQVLRSRPPDNTPGATGI